MRVRSLAIMLAAAALGTVVVRAGLFAALAEQDPARAASLWPDHPDAIFATGLEEVGRSAAEGSQIDRTVVARMLAAVSSAPLAPEPFLVRGVDAQLAGNERIAGQAFVEARRRDPRSIPARYFLADHYLRTGEVRPGLDEIATLARLVPHSAEKVAPYLVAFAKMPGGLDDVKSVLRDHPELEPVLLRALSVDAANAETVLALWSGGRGPGSKGWQERLVRELIAAGQFSTARVTWARFAGRSAGEAMLDLPFDGRNAPPPFGWQLTSGADGIAETVGEGQLHLLHYGRSDVTLASRLLTLSPGRYRMAMRVRGALAQRKRIAWSLTCLPSKSELMGFDLSAAGAGGALARSFSVPSACPAQELKLIASAPDFPEQADVTISAFRIQPEDR